MSRSRIGSLGRRLSYWLALQSLAGLVVVCAAVYGATHLGFQARQSESWCRSRCSFATCSRSRRTEVTWRR
jgi:hypothetical protein